MNYKRTMVLGLLAFGGSVVAVSPLVYSQLVSKNTSFDKITKNSEVYNNEYFAKDIISKMSDSNYVSDPEMITTANSKQSKRDTLIRVYNQSTKIISFEQKAYNNIDKTNKNIQEHLSLLNSSERKTSSHDLSNQYKSIDKEYILDFSHIFKFQNVNSLFTEANGVWTNQDLRFGFNEEIILAMKYLSDFSQMIKDINLNYDKLMTISGGGIAKIKNSIDSIIYGRRTTPNELETLLREYLYYCQVNDVTNLENTIRKINEKSIKEEIEIFKKYKNSGATIPNDINEWGFMYDVALPEYLSNDIVCDIQYNGFEYETIKLWDHNTGMQKINFKTRKGTNISSIKLSNIRFENLTEDTYTGLDLVNFFGDQENIIKHNGVVDYYLAFREDARNVLSTNFKYNDDYVESKIDTYLISNIDPSLGVIDKQSFKINNVDNVKKVLDETYTDQNSLPIFNNVYQHDFGKQFSNWTQAKDYFNINGMTVNNSTGRPVDKDIFFKANNAYGYYYGILEIKNFNFNENTENVNGDFYFNVRNKILNSKSLFALDSGDSTSQYFLAKLKTDKVTSISKPEIINDQEIKEIYWNPNNWIKSSLLVGDNGVPVYEWNKDIHFNIKVEPAKIKAETFDDALELLFDSQYNQLQNNDLVNRELIGYELDQYDNIDYTNPIYKYTLNNKYQLLFDNNSSYKLVNNTLQRSAIDELSFNTSIENFHDYLVSNQTYNGEYDSLGIWDKSKTISANDHNVKPESKTNKLLITIIGGSIGILALLMPLIMYIAIRNRKIKSSKEIEL